MSLYLGFDSSTQSLTATVIEVEDDLRQAQGRRQRRVVFEQSLNFDRDLPAYNTVNGVWRGQDPREVRSSPIMWAEALDRMMAVVSGAPGIDLAQLRAVSGSAQQHGSVYLNRTAAAVWRGLDPNRPLVSQIDRTFSRVHSPVWLDESTSAQCAEIERALGGPEAAARLTGSRVYERFTAAQIRKCAEDRPNLYEHTARIHLVSSYLASLLAGEDAPLDTGDASGMNLMDLVSGRWSVAAMNATAPDLEAKLPSIQAPWTIVGPLSTYWQRRYGFPPAKVVAWSGDNPCSLVGTGIIHTGHVAVSLGTSDTVFGWTAEPAAGVSHVFGSPTGGFMSLVCFRNGSLARERIRDAYALDWDGFARALEDTAPGNDGALMLPWFEPEITPHVSEAGVRRFGLDEHDLARNVRAVVEAQMMSMANHSAALTGGRTERIVAVGGASANRAILRVMADVFDAEVCQLAVGNAASLGAALRAFHADRFTSNSPLAWNDVIAEFTDPVPGSRVLPVPSHVAIYADLKMRYAEIEEEALASLSTPPTS